MSQRAQFDHRRYQPYPRFVYPQRRWPEQYIEQAPTWCSVDLRDGNQALIRPMSVEQKAELFHLLVRLGFKQIEVGFPAASETEYAFLRKLVDEQLIPEDVTIQILTQAREDLICRSFESLAGVKRAIVHVYNSTSTVQRQHVFQKDQEGVKAIAVQGARWVQQYAAKHPNTEWIFQYSPESFTATEPDYAIEVINAVIDVWQPQHGQPVIINLPATVEMSTPNVFADIVEYVIDRIDQRAHLSVSLHTHNDRGCAIAAAELGLMAGADRVEGTLLGNGERTGNTDLVAMAMNLYSQGIDPQLDFTDMKAMVECVEALTDIHTHPRHPYAGELVYAAFSGSHQDAIRKCLAQDNLDQHWNVAYLPIDPRDVGRNYEAVVRINSQSGKGGVLHVLERDYGITMPRWLQSDFAQHVQSEAERDGGEINAMRIRKLFDQHYLNTPDPWQLKTYELSSSEKKVNARIELINGTRLEAEGSGALSALVQALQIRSGQTLDIEYYDEFTLGDTSNANAMACVKLRCGDTPHTAVALARDTTSAALQAVLNAFGRSVSA